MAVFTGGDQPEDLAIGSADHVRRVINRYAETGVAHIAILRWPPFDLDDYRRISDEIVSPLL
jgi:hypothetical protein